MEEQPTKMQEEAEQQQEKQQEEEATKKKEETVQKSGEAAKEQQHQLLREEELPCQNVLDVNQYDVDLNQKAHLIDDVVVGIASELLKEAEEGASFDDEVSVADNKKKDGKEADEITKHEKENAVERKGKKLERGKEAEKEAYKGENKDKKAQHTRKGQLKKKLPASLISPVVIKTINPNEVLTTQQSNLAYYTFHNAKDTK